MSSSLCCCEYVDENNESNHILACCCNCVELDLLFDRVIRCKAVPKGLVERVMATVNDRLRVPWKGGAKRVSWDAILPVIFLPLTLFVAAQSVWVSVITFTFLPLFLMYLYFICMSCNPHTHFFHLWSIMSILLTFVVFEFVAVKLLEIRHDENAAFTCLTMIVLICFYKVKETANQSFVSDEWAVEIHGKVNTLCPFCNIKVPARAFHCHICNTCIMKRDQHCIWLNCCIGQSNHRWYMLLLVTILGQLILCSDLILTTACHPFKVWGALMLPDDCSDIYFDPIYAVCFVTALYCLEASLFIVVLIFHEFWMISLGMTGHEWRTRAKWSKCCGILSSRPYSKGIFLNWLRYIKGVDVPLIQHNI